MEREQTIRMTEDELQREREAAAAKAVKKLVEDEMKPLIDQLRADLRQAAIARDLIPEAVLLDWLGVSRKTLRQRWGIPHATKQGNTRFYDWHELEEHLRTETEAQKTSR